MAAQAATVSRRSPVAGVELEVEDHQTLVALNVATSEPMSRPSTWQSFRLLPWIGSCNIELLTSFCPLPEGEGWGWQEEPAAPSSSSYGHAGTNKPTIAIAFEEVKHHASASSCLRWLNSCLWLCCRIPRSSAG